ncbi:XVIPCD domain-containing protein [Pseudomonas sp. CGJS7]|uniref:XVIPCD domain-containing protein n=1 Tax=Pseudomonas sp. CGJS7 TaxID=3109348 RepID=UPI00300AD572
MTITTRQYAQLSQHSYDPPETTTDGARPFVVADGVQFNVLKSVDNPSGYQGTIFQRQDTGEIVVAHRGSEFDRQPLADGLIADGGMVADRANRQLKDALALTDEASAMSRGMAAKYGQAPQVTVTGHSLGGCLTQLTAAKRGLNGEAFNPYGAVSLDQQVPEGGTQVINHVMAGDVVSAASKHFGKVRMYAEPVELDVLKAAGYEDNGSQWDIRHPPKAAVEGGDSHRMHHFLDIDGNGRPDRSILSQPQALELAEKHRPMFDKYRGDIENLRAGVTISAAVARGAQGIAGEIGRHFPDKPESPFKDADGARPQRTDTPERGSDPRAPRHPDNPMYLQIRGGIGALHEREGRPFDEVAERTTASLFVASKTGGLSQVDHVLPGQAAQSDPKVFAVQGDLHDPAHRRAQVSVAEAAQTPVDESFRKLETMAARLAQAPAQEQTQDQTRSVTTRSV